MDVFASTANFEAMFPVGGVEVMLALVALSGGLGVLLFLALRERLGWLTAGSIAAFLWALAVIGILTLIPANGAPGVVPAEGRLATCSWDVGGPAPEGFWIFAGGQRMLNVLVFVPAGVLLVLALARWRAAWVLVPLGLAGLAAYSVAIEATQLELARIDRACDVTDVIDNVTGAVLGVGIGVVLALLLRPWRRR
jgi:VanZ like family